MIDNLYLDTRYPKELSGVIEDKSSNIEKIIYGTSINPSVAGRYIELSKYMQMNDSEKIKKK